jgi:two-component system, sensor histidine kinase YesM
VRLSTLQSRLMATMLLIVGLLAGLALLIFAHARTTAITYQERLSDLVKVAELTRSVDQGVQVLGRLATGPSPGEADAEFRQARERIYQLRRDLPTRTASPVGARLLLDLDAMADSFLVEAGAAIYAFQGADLERYFQHDREAAVIAGYVRDTADRLLAAELDAYRQVYPEVTRRDRLLGNANMAVLAAVTVLSLLFAWSFARGVTDPLRSLAQAAKRIAGGDLAGPAVPVGSGDEMKVLGRAFNQMQESLRRQVAELEAKAELERRLQQEEMENLQVHTLLREAELRALQSQVNPHFLFNTLNVVQKTALIEGADRTCTLLETVADLLRYSLRQLDQPVTLGAEVAQVRRYATIQGERFRDRIRFAEELEESALDLPIPCLTLQPLVENAVIHGIGNRERGGTVRLSVRREDDRVRIIVSDDGKGIPPDRLAALNDEEGPVGAALGHTTGLGLHNVRRRLQLFYQGSPVAFAVNSRYGESTSVIIDLPYAAEGGERLAHPGS